MEPRYQCYARDGEVRWRLLGSNNRALARSALAFAGVAQALEDARDVARQAASAPIELLSEAGTAWRWVLVTGTGPRATSAGPYARRLECVRAAERFRSCAGSARWDATTVEYGARPSRRRRPQLADLGAAVAGEPAPAPSSQRSFGSTFSA